MLQRATRFANEQMSGLSDAYVSCTPFEELRSQCGFDDGDLPGKGGLRDMAALSRAREVALLGNRHHIPHPPQLDLSLHSDNIGQICRLDLFHFE